ncbi:MAG: hypothetical protein ACI4Q3_00480 [Kiritimatiellia bacterium]
MTHKSAPRRAVAAAVGFIVGIAVAGIAIFYLPFHFAAEGWRQE